MIKSPMLRLALLFLCVTAVAATQDRIELGEINGSAFRIDIPEHWDGTLFVYCHGYSTTPVHYDREPAKDALKAFLDSGSAVAQSAYETTGWAVQRATVDTESLRRYFVRKYGQPKRTFVTGHSMGGFLTMMLMETRPTTYDGGLSMCGPLVATASLATNAFNARVVFDYFFPGALPNPVRVPADFLPTKESVQKLEQLMDGKPEASAQFRRFGTFKTNKEAAGVMDFLTFVLKDMAQRAGGNPFDNRGTIYTIDGNDNQLNERVKRYAADPGAFEYLRIYYNPTGHLVRPMLQVHTTFDPLVPPSMPNSYMTLASEAGSEEFFVQQFVERDGHCNISAGETGRAAQELKEWVQNQRKPQAGLLRIK